jgi:hypothetical protein
MKTRGLGLALAASIVTIGSPAFVAAQGRIEGTVVSTKLTACDFKPGTCEGSLVLDTGGKEGQVTIKVPKGTRIKRASDHLFLPGLKRSQVGITYTSDKGERIATSIEVTSAKP